MITLELPNVKYKDSFIEAIKECHKFLEIANTPSNNWWITWAKRYDIDRLHNDFENYVVKDSLDCKNGYLAKRWDTEVHTYWLIRKGTVHEVINDNDNEYEMYRFEINIS